jgi:hypothetical protein
MKKLTSRQQRIANQKRRDRAAALKSERQAQADAWATAECNFNRITFYLPREKIMEKLQANPVLKQVLADSLGGVLYNVANRDKYDKEELLAFWEELSPAQRESVGGIIKGAINFLQGN